MLRRGHTKPPIRTASERCLKEEVVTLTTDCCAALSRKSRLPFGTKVTNSTARTRMIEPRVEYETFATTDASADL